MKCLECKKDLESITMGSTINGGVNVWLDNTKRINLWVCKTPDCGKRDVVIAIPLQY